MVHWGWAVGALFGGVIFGFIILALFAAGVSEQSYRYGYNEGREEGFQAGLMENE